MQQFLLLMTLVIKAAKIANKTVSIALADLLQRY